MNTRPLSPMNFSPAFFQLKLFKSKNLWVSSFGRSVAYRGLVARHSMRREKLVTSVVASFSLAISLAVRGFHAGLQGYLEAIHRWQTRLWKGVQQRRNSGPFTTRVLAWYRFWLYFGVLGMIHGKLQIFFQMFSQISRTPDFERSFRVKRCGLYAGVYGTIILKIIKPISYYFVFVHWTSSFLLFIFSPKS